MGKEHFLLGINYWPANKAMYWWKYFDSYEIEQDFLQISKSNFKLLRLFLLWEDFQPFPDKISVKCLDNLKKCADTALKYNLKIMPTFFCGHMSGINWIPHWMLTGSSSAARFKVYSDGILRRSSFLNCYIDQMVIEAQVLQIEQVCTALKQHEAVFAYDLGNETSNCSIPPDRQTGRQWLRLMCSTIKRSSVHTPVTLGMHAEDLEEDRNMWPQDAAIYCDFLSMHAYPFYLSWVDDPLDYHIVPFMAIICRWLGEKPVLFQEFGAPTNPQLPPLTSKSYAKILKCQLYEEDAIYTYYQKCLFLLQEADTLGAFPWCYADYIPDLWNKPPLDENPHERHFGLFRYDGTPKQAVRAFSTPLQQTGEENKLVTSYPWLNKFDRNTFYNNPRENLQKMYQFYKKLGNENLRI